MYICHVNTSGKIIKIQVIEVHTAECLFLFLDAIWQNILDAILNINSLTLD